jgi:superfamily II DNA/RNA helicase
MNTQNSEVTSPQSSPAQNDSTTLISSFLNADLSSALSELGIKECSKVAQEQIVGLRSLDDRVFLTTNTEEFLESLVTALSSEVIEVTGRGHTLIVVPEDLIGNSIKIFAKYDLELLNLSDSKIQVTDPRHSVAGSATQVADFFRSDQGRAIKIARVIILSLTAHDLECLKDAMSEACKRGQRPQLTLVEAEQNNTVADITRAFLRSTANLETHHFVQLQANGKHRTEALIEALESESLYPSLVFCKNNAEVTAVENSLRHRGIRCRKLVGKLPPHKAREIVDDLKSGEARVLLATDGPSEQIELELFKFIINFSIPSEPESYIHRTESPLGPISNRKILSIITPLDRSNFDYIKRIVAAKFEETSGPDSEILLQRQLERIEADAIEKFAKCEERIKDMALKLSERSRGKELIGQLLYLLESRNSAVSREPSRVRNDFGGESDGDGDDRRKEKGGFRIGNRGQRDEKGSDRDNRDRNSRDRDSRDRDSRDRDSRDRDSRDRDTRDRDSRDRDTRDRDTRDRDTRDRDTRDRDTRDRDTRDRDTRDRDTRDRDTRDRDTRDRDTRDRDSRDRDSRDTRDGGRSNEGWKRNEENQQFRGASAGNASRRERDNHEEGDYDRSGNDFEGRGQNDDYTRQYPKFVVKKFSRMYLNKGSKAGVSADYLKELKLGEAEPIVINCSVRPHYAFIDVPEEFQERLTTEISANPPGGIPDITITKAITIASKERLKNDDEVVISEPEAELAS